MPFPEAIKNKVKKKANFTCCWCRDINNKVEIHHIIPESKGGQDTGDNAAPLCSNCHTLYGNNPDLRKEIRLRRDHWYETNKRKLEIIWPEGLHVPLLRSSEVIKPQIEKTTHRTNIGETTDRFRMIDSIDLNNDPPKLMLSFIFDKGDVITNHYSGNCMTLLAEAPFGVAFSIVVCANNDWDVNGFLSVLNNKTDIWMLRGKSFNFSDENKYRSRTQADYLLIYRLQNGENRIVASTQLPSKATISIQARFTNDVSKSLAKYLRNHGFD